MGPGRPDSPDGRWTDSRMRAEPLREVETRRSFEARGTAAGVRTLVVDERRCSRFDHRAGHRSRRKRCNAAARRARAALAVHHTMQIPGGAIVACNRGGLVLMRAVGRRSRKVVVMLHAGGHRRTFAHGSAEQHARGRVPLQGYGHEEQPRKYGAQRASHAAESKAGSLRSGTAGRASGGAPALSRTGRNA